MKRVVILIGLLLGAVIVNGCNLISGINDLTFRESDSVTSTDETTLMDTNVTNSDVNTNTDTGTGPDTDGDADSNSDKGTDTDTDACASYVCDSGQLCHQRLCDGSTPHTCTNLEGAWQWRTTTACDDGSGCTSGDTCAGGSCQGTWCGPGTWCNANACETCNTDEHCGKSCVKCTQDGQICNENQGICVVNSCTGEFDFTPCETLTADPMDRSYDICISEVCQSPGCGDERCNAPGPHFGLADTSQRACFNETDAMICPAPGEAFYGQDAQYGWDVDAAHVDTLRFTVDTAVTDYPVVKDNVTGLMWQGCSRGRRENNCATQDGTATSTWSEALSYCDSLSWGGHTDWRLPDEYELDSIVDAGMKVSPTIYTTAFPATSSNGFWSSSSSGFGSQAGCVFFSSGQVVTCNKSDLYDARCVRGEPIPQPSRFARDTSVESYPVVIDNTTGLEWQGCAVGTMGNACWDLDLSVTDKWFTWQNALSHCENLSWAGHSDWRLPNRKELRSIVENHSSDNISIDTIAFPSSPCDLYWSSSSYASDVSAAWIVDFMLGDVGPCEKNYGQVYTRCVRSGP